MTETTMPGPTAQVRVASGVVEGVTQQGVARFLGVPFAAPPFGPRRMLPPHPVEPWQGVRSAVDYGPTVPKAPYAEQYLPLFAEVEIPGDDCLNLNIWTSSTSRDAGLPVMVWIHGGAFAHGSGSSETYDGSAFARDGVVCVTINYRLGAEGFLDFGDGVANLGLLDQVAALEWVQRNIVAFGGDPARVTVAGESAGAMSVTALLAMPQTKGLFARAIAQSGAGLQTMSAHEGRLVLERLADIANVSPDRSSFAAVAPDVLADAAHQLVVEVQTDPDPERWGLVALTMSPFAPVIDGKVLPEHPLDALRAGRGGSVPLLTGWNREEGRLFLVQDGAISGIDDEVLRLTATGLGLPDTAVDAYGQDRPGEGPGDLLAQIFGDRLFAIPTTRVAEARCDDPRYADVWMYRFDHDADRTNSGFGAAHFTEVAHVFDTIDQPSAQAIIGGSPSREVADLLHGVWVRFVRSGDPGWPSYDVVTRTTALLDTEMRVVDDPMCELRRLWDGVS